MTQDMLWEARSRTYGASMKAVCIKSFPACINAAIHRWQTRRVLVYHSGDRVLDIGAGYGRLSKELALTGVKTAGLDVSHTFAKLYKEYAGRPCLVGSAARLPFKNASFDGAIAVVSWRYLDIEGRRAAAREAFRVLKSGARLVVIEDNRFGKFLSTFFGLGNVLMRILGKSSNTAGHTFTIKEVKTLLDDAGFVIEKLHGFSVATFFMPLLLVLGFLWPRCCAALAGVLFAVDERIDLPWLSLNVAFVAMKN